MVRPGMVLKSLAILAGGCGVLVYASAAPAPVSNAVVSPAGSGDAAAAKRASVAGRPAKSDGAAEAGVIVVPAADVKAALDALERAAGAGALPNGAQLDGPLPDGPLPDGAQPDGARLDGARLDGARPDGARLDGAQPDGARLLRELTTPTDPHAAAPTALTLDATTRRLLVDADMGDFVAEAFARDRAAKEGHSVTLGLVTPGFVTPGLVTPETATLGLRDVTPPVVTVVAPNGGETFDPDIPTEIRWTATDDTGISHVDVFVSYDGGASYLTAGAALVGTNGLTWYPPIRPTTSALVKVTATDYFANPGHDTSDSFFTIKAHAGGLIPTTLRDFDLPGTQPFEHGFDMRFPTWDCAPCHGDYDPVGEPFYAWRGSMMANATRDPLFKAALAIANQDAPASGDMCLRCHTPQGWMAGRSSPTDGRLLVRNDMEGVSCDVCHRMVDPFYDALENPIEDVSVLAALSNPPSEFGNGMFIIDPNGDRRGPFSDVVPAHVMLVSPFHQEAAFCGTCHDVSNPAYERDGHGGYGPNELDAPATDVSPHTLMPLERTYSEWLNSAYNSPEGIYAPQFGGNKLYVSTCQDCHMRDVTGRGCFFADLRDDLPAHDLTGGSTWLPGLFHMLFPDDINPAAQATAIERARYMLRNSADLEASVDGSALTVRVTNNTGHKLPTGYPEGRRMWLNVKYFDTSGELLGESGAYNAATGELALDATTKVYEAHLGIDETIAEVVGKPTGPTFHFALNNKIFKDNRIPPRGFTNAAYAEFGGAPVGETYADGQYWNDTQYAMPSCAATIEVTLYYQSTSKEYIEFLRDENTTDATGQDMYDLWNNYGKCPPEAMATVTVTLPDCNENGTPDWCEPIGGGDYDLSGQVDLADFAKIADCLEGPNAMPNPEAAGCAPTCLQAFDADDDDDVDLADFAEFQRTFDQ
jgi:hypothetical protein